MLARVLLEQLRREVDARAVTDEDIRSAMADRWLDFDRPSSVRVVHAVVRFQSPADEPRARAVADAIRRAVTDVAGEAEFRRAAAAVPPDGFEVKVETLGPVAADGRLVAVGEGRLVEPFARAAHAIADVGGTSPVTKTEFGFHVIQLLARQPARSVPLAEARPQLEPSVRTGRLKEAHAALVRSLVARDRPAVARASGELTGLVDLEP